MSGIPSWARVGAKVVFVEAAGMIPPRRWEQYPVVGQIYTIRWVGAGVDGSTAIRLLEIVNPVAEYLEFVGECNFYARRFRPLISQQDDIETHFKALLDVPEQVGA